MASTAAGWSFAQSTSSTCSLPRASRRCRARPARRLGAIEPGRLDALDDPRRGKPGTGAASGRMYRTCSAAPTMSVVWVDHLRIMDFAGHKTRSMFDRYNSRDLASLEAAARMFSTHSQHTSEGKAVKAR